MRRTRSRLFAAALAAAGAASSGSAAPPAPGSVTTEPPPAAAPERPDPATRLGLARHALNRDRPAEATRELLALVRDAVDAGDDAPALDWLPAVVGPLREAAAADPAPVAAERDRYAGLPGAAALRAFATLNAALDREDLTLAWFDTAFAGGAAGAADPADAAAARGAAQQLGPLLRADGRFASMTRLWSDPLEEVGRRAAAARAHLRRFPAAERDAAALPLLRGLAEVHAATLAADPADPRAEAIADAVVAAALRPPAFAAAALAEAGEAFGVVNEDHLRRLRAVPPGAPAAPWAKGEGTATAPAGFAALGERIALRLGRFPRNTLPAAEDPDAWTARDRRGVEEAFHRAVLLGGLERIHGLPPDPDRPVNRWLAAAAAHAAWSRAWSGQRPPATREGPPVPTDAELAGLAEAAIAAGGPAAADPLLRRLAAEHLSHGGRRGAAEPLRDTPLDEALATAWHPFLRARLLHASLPPAGDGRREAALHRLVTLTAASLAEPVAAPAVRGRDDRQVRLAAALRVFDRKSPLGVRWQSEVAALVEADEGIDPWVCAAFLGRHRVASAWAARGFGTGTRVVEDGWDVWRRELEAADTHLRRAVELEPGFVEPWVALLDVSKRGGDRGRLAREAFEGATAAELDHAPAWDRYLWSVGPLWGGDAEAMRPLAVEAVATGRFDTGVPAYALRILRGIGGHGHPGMGWHLLDNPLDRALVSGYEAARGHAVGLGLAPEPDASARAELVAMRSRTREPVPALRGLEALWEAGETDRVRRWLDAVDHDEQGLVWQEMTMLAGRHGPALCGRRSVWPGKDPPPRPPRRSRFPPTSPTPAPSTHTSLSAASGGACGRRRPPRRAPAVGASRWRCRSAPRSR